MRSEIANFVFTLGLLVIMVAGCTGNKPDTLRDNLRYEFLNDCGDQSCWRGVRPGVTSADDALEALQGAGVTFNYLGDPQSDAAWNYVWDIYDENALYGNANMNVSNGIIEQIAFGIVVCPADFIDAFGEPDLIYKGDNDYGLHYNDELMVVIVHRTETFPEFRGLYMFSETFYTDFVEGIAQAPDLVDWQDIQDELTQACAE